VQTQLRQRGNHAEFEPTGCFYLLSKNGAGGTFAGERIIRTWSRPWAEQFLEIVRRKTASCSNKTRSVRLELKAAGDAITTTGGRTIVSAVALALRQRIGCDRLSVRAAHRLRQAWHQCG
jgi:hypothetical protein